jgi:hypothetical protein
MAQVDQATQQAAANAEETSSAVEELAGRARELAALVDEFELGADDASTESRPADAGWAPRGTPAREREHGLSPWT